MLILFTLFIATNTLLDQKQALQAMHRNILFVVLSNEERLARWESYLKPELAGLVPAKRPERELWIMWGTISSFCMDILRRSSHIIG